MPGKLQPLDDLDLTVQIPHHFRCPISLDLMRDPVAVSSGQTYERHSIEQWIAAGNSTCPVTRTPLSDFAPIVPNHTLRRLIHAWCISNRIPTPKHNFADPAAVQSLLSMAASSSSAVRLLRGLVHDSEKNRSLAAAHGAREILIGIVFSDESLDASELVSEALQLLVMFRLTEPECASIASDPNRLGFLVRLLFDPSIEIRVNSAALIELVLTGLRSMDLRSRVSGSGLIFEGVLDILKNPESCNPRAIKIGVRALYRLCRVKHTRQDAISAGAPDILVDLLAADHLSRSDAEWELATIELLCRVPAGRAAFASNALAVPLLVKTIAAAMKVSDSATEYATGALIALCTASERCRQDAASAGGVGKMLVVVQSDCTERLKRKAQMLLKLLILDSWADESFGDSDEVTPF